MYVVIVMVKVFSRQILYDDMYFVWSQHVCLCGVLWESPGGSRQESPRPLHPWQDGQEGQAQQNLLSIPRAEEVRGSQFSFFYVI